MTGEHAYANV